MHKELGEDSARTADPNCPKGYSRLYDIMLSNETRGKPQALLRDWLGISPLVVSSCFPLHHLPFIGFTSVIFLFITIIFIILFYFSYSPVLISTYEFSYFYSSKSLPTWGEQVSSCVVLSCQLGLNYHTQLLLLHRHCMTKDQPHTSALLRSKF